MPAVEIEGIGEVEFPDTMSPQEIQRAIETDILPKSAAAPPKPTDPIAPLKKSLGRIWERLGEAGQATLDIPATTKRLVTGEGGVEDVIGPGGLLRGIFSFAEPLYAPIGESMRTGAEEAWGANPHLASILGAATEMGAGIALPFVRTAPTTTGRALQRIGIGRAPEATLEAERALEMGRQAGRLLSAAERPKGPRVAPEVEEAARVAAAEGPAPPLPKSLAAEAEAGRIERPWPGWEPPTKPGVGRIEPPKPREIALPSGAVSEVDVFDRIQAIRKTTEDIRTSIEPGKTVIFDPESLAAGRKNPIGAVYGGKTLDLVSDVFDEVSVVSDVPPGRLLEAIKKDKENPVYLRLKDAVRAQLQTEAVEGHPIERILGIEKPQREFVPVIAGGIEGPVPDDLFSKNLKPYVHQKMTAASKDYYAQFPEQFMPEMTVADNMVHKYLRGELPLDWLQRYGLSPEEFLPQFRESIRQSAQRMAYHSQVMRTLNLSKPEAEMLRRAGFQVDDATILRPWWKRLDDVRRGLMVTQMATAARNFITQMGRVGLDTLQAPLDAALQRMTGRAQVTHPVDGLETFLRVFGRNKEAAEKILSRFPKQRDLLLSTYHADLPVKAKGVLAEGGSWILSGAEQAVHTLNWANRFQEFLVRRGVFMGKLAQQVRQKGDDLGRIIGANDLTAIQADDVAVAVKKALEVTFASRPEYGTTAHSFVRTVNKLPWFATLAIPYPRFLVNSLKFFYDYSPAGFLKLLSATERAKFAAGDTGAISRASLGLAMLGAAYQLRASEYAGERWYEVRPSGGAGGRVVDTRAFNPFAAYLFVADILHRIKSGTLYRLEAKDIFMGVLSANVRAGTGLFVVDQITNGLAQLGDPAKAARAIQNFAGEIGASFLTPLQQLSDVMAEFDETMKVVRERRGEPFTGPMKAKIPGMARELPPVFLPTRSRPLMREETLLRQLTGITVGLHKNTLEKELDRLQFQRNEILPSTGNPEADQLVTRHMGELSERFLVPFVESERYTRLDNANRGIVLRERLKSIRERARDRAEREAPELFKLLREERKPRRMMLPEQRQRYLRGLRERAAARAEALRAGE